MSSRARSILPLPVLPYAAHLAARSCHLSMAAPRSYRCHHVLLVACSIRYSESWEGSVDSLCRAGLTDKGLEPRQHGSSLSMSVTRYPYCYSLRLVALFGAGPSLQHCVRRRQPDIFLTVCGCYGCSMCCSIEYTYMKSTSGEVRPSALQFPQLARHWSCDSGLMQGRRTGLREARM